MEHAADGVSGICKDAVVGFHGAKRKELSLVISAMSVGKRGLMMIIVMMFWASAVLEKH